MLTTIVLVISFTCCCAFNVDLDWTYVLSNPDYRQAREAYFGYTVGLVTTATSAWALVGAPRANDTLAGSNVVERGALYLCPLPSSSGPCRQITVTTAANGSPGGGGNEEYINLQDYGWLGGSLDLRPEIPDSMIATCSPRWINQQKIGYDTRYFMNGACYLTTTNELTSNGPSRSWRKVIPLIDRNKQTIIDNNQGLFYYELGQAGLSAHVAEGNNGLWLGAPGIKQWSGSVAKVTESSAGGIEGTLRAGEWFVTESEVFPPEAQSSWFDYYGYSMGSGYFFGSDLNIVAGSPRYDLLGKVSVFDIKADGQIRVYWEATGPRLGSYFGAAIATGDVNGDGWSELFVGAPLHTNIDMVTDSGLVVIYSRKANLDDLYEAGRLVGSGQGGARFGSAVMVVGDLDRDGYNDLAVGAPYEADGSGAVYIYRGSADGLQTTISQRLSASDASLKAHNLKGFGISLSRGADVDKNGYADLAVGAHEGDGSAVVLRTRPVLHLTLQVTAEHEILVESGITFDVTSCLKYSGHYIKDETDVILNGQVDGGLSNPQAVFADSGTAVIIRAVSLRKSREQCIIFPVKLEKTIEDYTRPLQISFQAKVAYDDPGCEKCGLTSPSSSYRSAVSLPLAIGCGPDSVCTPELGLSVTWKGSSTLALRSESFVTLSVVVSVGGKESSYKGKVIVLLPEGLSAHQPLPFSCTQGTESIACDLPSPMSVGEKEELEISVEESGDILEETELVLQILTSASGAKYVKKELTLSVIEDVELLLNGQVDEDLITYSEPSADSSITYQVSNRGATRVSEVRLDINIPMIYEGSTFALITSQPQETTYGGLKKSDCILQSLHNNVTTGGSVNEPPYKTTTKLVCGKQPLLTCVKFICTVRQVDHNPLVTFKVTYNITILSEKFGNNFTLASYTNAIAAYGHPVPKMTTERGLWTTLLPRGWVPPTKSTPVWAYVVGVLVGLLILAVVVGVLFKIGFFKRKRPGQTPGDAEEGAEGAGDGGGEAAPLQGGEGVSDAAVETGTTVAEVETDADAD